MVYMRLLIMTMIDDFPFLHLSLPSKMFGQHLRGSQQGVGVAERGCEGNMDVGGERG